MESERIFLRPFVIGDVEEVFAVCRDFNVTKYLPLPYPYTLDMAKSWISSQEENKDKRLEFAVILKSNNKLIGSIGLGIENTDRHGEVGYWISPDYWGKGYATEALKLLIDFAFKKLKFHKIYAKHYVENPASGKVMQNCGMSLVGTLKDHSFKNGKFNDVKLYELINKHD